MVKHQSKCYRIYKGKEIFNWCDLEFDQERNNEIIAEAKDKFKVVKKEKVNRQGYSFYRLFVSLNDLRPNSTPTVEECDATDAR